MKIAKEGLGNDQVTKYFYTYKCINILEMQRQLGTLLTLMNNK